MGRQQTLVQLSDELVALLDERAAKRGVSRSAVIREAVEAYLAHDREAEISRRIVEGYQRVPQQGDDLEEWSRVNTARNFAALAAEERAAGAPEW